LGTDFNRLPKGRGYEKRNHNRAFLQKGEVLLDSSGGIPNRKRGKEVRNRVTWCKKVLWSRYPNPEGDLNAAEGAKRNEKGQGRRKTRTALSQTALRAKKRLSLKGRRGRVGR